VSELNTNLTPAPADRRFRVVLSLIVAMTVVGLSNGLLLAYLPIRLAGMGFDPSVAGMLVAMLAVGGIIGCFVAGPLIQSLGQAKAFIAGGLLLLVSHAMTAVTADPTSWAIARVIYGIALTQLFIVSYGWINASVTNQARGTVQTLFYTSYIVALGVGGFGIAFLDVSGNMTPKVSMVLATLGLIPMLIPGLPETAVPKGFAIRPIRAWKISPVGFVGMFFVGGLTLLVQGFAPIYGQAIGFSPAQIGLMLLLMQIGIIAVQMPAGFVSDKLDRRWVLVICAVMITVFSGITSQVTGLNFYLLVAAFGLWAGATETIFSIATAQSNDHARSDEYVMLSATLTTVWSVGAFVIPAATSLLTDIMGPTAYMYVAGALALSYAVFVGVRMTMRDVPEPNASTEAAALYEPPRL